MTNAQTPDQILRDITICDSFNILCVCPSRMTRLVWPVRCRRKKSHHPKALHSPYDKTMKNTQKLLLLATILSNIGFAQINESIPTDSWIYESVKILQISGYFRDLDQGTQPYTRQKIAQQLVFMNDEMMDNKSVEIEYQRLITEFSRDITYLENSKSLKEDNIRLSSMFKDVYNDKKNYLFYRLSGALYIKSGFTLKYSAYIDQRLNDDPFYNGYKWRGFQGYQEQMYIAYNRDNFSLKYGRDYVKWGYGNSGRLFISDNSRAFNMLALKIQTKWMSFNTFISQLDDMYSANRYLTATRAEIKLQNKVYIGIGQLALYGGQKQVFDFTMSNPLAFYSFTQDNDHKPMNMMLYTDFACYFRNKYRFYGEFLIDDFQIDREEKGDLEPNELAFLFGIEGIDLIYGINGWCEFTQARNRTYNVPDARPFEKYLHNNLPIAHPLGTDFQSFNCNFDRWLGNHLKLGLGYALIRKGEGTIRGAFTEPWMDDEVTMSTGYEEKIPYGIVETTNNLSCSIHYEYNTHIQSEVSIGFEQIENSDHVESRRRSNPFININLLIDYNWLLKM